jgi:outer membrane protein assembly factor BamB
MSNSRIILIVFLLQGLFLFGSCEKWRKLTADPMTFPTNLEVVWNAFFHSDGTADYFWDYEVANNQYIVVSNRYDRDEGGGKPRGIGVYNMQTGERHNAWKNDPGGIFAPSEFEYLQDCKVAGKNKDIILVYSGYDLFAYNLHSGQRMWRLNIPDEEAGSPKMSAIGDYAFISYGPGPLSKTWKRLAIVDIYSGEKTDVLQLYAEDNYDFAINPPSAYVNAEGDTLLFFTTSAWNFNKIHGRVHAYCYNMTIKQMIWINKQFTSDMDATSAQPPPFVIENNKLIVTSLRAIHCFNKYTGELIWQIEGLGFADRPPLYYEGKIYIRSGDPCILMCLDAQNGQKIWENTTLNPVPSPDGAMDIYKNRLYFSAWGPNAIYHLACVDIHTGHTLWTDRGPYGSISFGVFVNQETGYLYCNTGWSLMCVDLNKTPNGKKDK